MGRRIDPADKAEAVELAAFEGVRCAARQLGYTENAIRHWCVMAGVTPARGQVGRRRKDPVACSVNDCDTPARALGLCKLHYSRARAARKLTIAPAPVTSDRFLSPCHDLPVEVDGHDDVTGRVHREHGRCPECGSRWRRTVTVMAEPTSIRYRKDQTA